MVFTSSSRRLSLNVIALCLAAVPWAAAQIPQPDTTIRDWNEELNREIFRLSINSNRATRTFAAIQTAQWRALTQLLVKKKIKLDRIPSPSSSGKITQAYAAIKTVVARAALQVIEGNQNTALYPNANLFPPNAANVNYTRFQVLYNSQVGDSPDAQAISIADSVAAKVLSERTVDKAWPAPPTYNGHDMDFVWRRTPSWLQASLSNTVDAAWGQNIPFTLKSGDQFRAPAPLPRQSPLYKRDYDELRTLYSNATLGPNDPSRVVAEFWRGNTELYSFQQAWAVNAGEKLNIIEPTKLFAILASALSDSRVAAYETKYFYSTWRPRTAIPLGNGAGFNTSSGAPVNTVAFVADASWDAAIATPQHPEYTSGHVVSGAASSYILQQWTGKDNYNFTLFSLGDASRGPRTFTSFSEALEEQSFSRIAGGVHWRFTNEITKVQGTQVGKWAWNFYKGKSCKTPRTLSTLTEDENEHTGRVLERRARLS